jgi:hypothetical protein
MDQQDYSNFFTISTALDLPSKSQWKLKLLILFALGRFGHKEGSTTGNESVPETY